jgi:hypothetical protein
VRFDHFSEDDFSSKTLPDGPHEVEIVNVKDIVSKKTGKPYCIITFRDVNDSYDSVVKLLNPKEKRDAKTAMDINEALGRPWNADIDESIEGMRLTIVSKRATKDGERVLDRDGNQEVWINGYMPAASGPGEPAAEKPRANRTPTQKADAASSAPNDDIPF